MSLQISCANMMRTYCAVTLLNLFTLLKEIMQNEEGDQIILPAVFNTENRLSF